MAQAAGNIEKRQIGGLIEVRNVTMRFGGLTALDDLSLTVQPLEIHGVIGPNGSGKSTLFNVINGIYKPHSGHVFFEGKEITGFAPYMISRLGVSRT